ncbi:MAG: tRNA (N(6)-L-threonylcarbamoyladenosine(37)-C(2))-methylthiotransferase MtaB, partial [Bacteroidota bacterium]|nr:tRNA (N(6)-L-threonylcarbamoyladenosine(37)-C(2))-methylthiotransferase MtaB [Bacteroidota bacterium]
MMDDVVEMTPKVSKPRIAFYTLGCKLNFSETATISRDFHSDSYKHVDFDTPAEVYVINTCSVTENADRKFKGLVKKVLKQNPKAFVAAIGCYAQLQPEALAEIDGVDLVLGATEKFKLMDYLGDLTKNPTGAIHSC